MRHQEGRVEHLYAIADGEVIAEEEEPEAVMTSGRSTSGHTQGGSGPRAADGTRIPPASPGPPPRDLLLTTKQDGGSAPGRLPARS